jgi:hypothetical protein
LAGVTGDRQAPMAVDNGGRSPISAILSIENFLEKLLIQNFFSKKPQNRTLLTTLVPISQLMYKIVLYLRNFQLLEQD